MKEILEKSKKRTKRKIKNRGSYSIGDLERILYLNKNNADKFIQKLSDYNKTFFHLKYIK